MPEKKLTGRDFPLAATPNPNPIQDSSAIYTKRMLSNMDMADRSKGELKKVFTEKWKQNAKDLERQSKKNKPGYDKMGFPIKKQ